MLSYTFMLNLLFEYVIFTGVKIQKCLQQNVVLCALAIGFAPLVYFSRNILCVYSHPTVSLGIGSGTPKNTKIHGCSRIYTKWHSVCM